jgi:hypothetical protein
MGAVNSSFIILYSDRIRVSEALLKILDLSIQGVRFVTPETEWKMQGLPKTLIVCINGFKPSDRALLDKGHHLIHIDTDTVEKDSLGYVTNYILETAGDLSRELCGRL